MEITFAFFVIRVQGASEYFESLSSLAIVISAWCRSLLMMFLCCQQVPSFPNDIAMALIEEELGKPWQEIYSELSPSPIAAGKQDKLFIMTFADGCMTTLLKGFPYTLGSSCRFLVREGTLV